MSQNDVVLVFFFSFFCVIKKEKKKKTVIKKKKKHSFFFLIFSLVGLFLAFSFSISLSHNAMVQGITAVAGL